MSIAGKDAVLPPTPWGPNDIIYALGTADEWGAHFSGVTVREEHFLKLVHNARFPGTPQVARLQVESLASI